MIKEVIATGETVEEAEVAARAELRAPEDAYVSIEVLELAKKKTLGLFGGSKAKVRASYELPDEKPKAKPAAETRPAPRPRPEKPSASPKPEKAPITKQEKPIEQKTELKKGRTEYKDVPLSEIQATVDYLKTILNALGLESTEITAKSNNDELFIHVESEEDYGILIGRRGETLDAVQYLIRLFANRKEQDYTRISINVGNYRERRESNLKQIAKKTANQVLRYGRQSSLEPMNPYERRLIHTAIQEIKGVTSYSVGTDSDRRVVIALQEGFTPTHSRGGGDRRNQGRGGSYNRNKNNSSRSNFNKPSGQATSAEKRTQAKDAASVSLYGKIEPKKEEE